MSGPEKLTAADMAVIGWCERWVSFLVEESEDKGLDMTDWKTKYQGNQDSLSEAVQGGVPVLTRLEMAAALGSVTSMESIMPILRTTMPAEVVNMMEYPGDMAIQETRDRLRRVLQGGKRGAA